MKCGHKNSRITQKNQLNEQTMKTKNLLYLFTILTLFCLIGCDNTQTANQSSTNDQTTTTNSTSNNSTDNSSNQSSSSNSTTTSPSSSKNMSQAETEKNKQLQLAPAKTGEKVVTLETDYGPIKFKLFEELAPEMCKNFETLAKQGKYNNVPFHRVIKDFMIQTGDFTNQNGTGGYSYKGKNTELEDEISPALKHLYGTVSMANRGPDTNGSQFFIVTNHDGTSYLDGDYSIFGQVIDGMNVAEKISTVEKDRNDKPLKTVLIKKVTIEVQK